MNFKDKNDKNNVVDDMNIKSHLNTSLDLKGIHVSEDLINRTMEAIKEQPNENIEKSKEINSAERIVPWNKYVRRFAGVAAAVFIVLVGANAMKLMNGMGSKSSDSGRSENTSCDQDDATSIGDVNYSLKMTEGSTTTETDQMDEELRIQDSETKEESTIAKDRNEDLVENQSILDIQANGVMELSFQDISILSAKQLESITITNHENQKEVILTNQAEILDFYNRMEPYLFVSELETTEEPYYSIDIKGVSEELCTIRVGDSSSVHYSLGDVVIDNTYGVLDQEEFKQELSELFTD